MILHERVSKASLDFQKSCVTLKYYIIYFYKLISTKDIQQSSQLSLNNVNNVNPEPEWTPESGYNALTRRQQASKKPALQRLQIFEWKWEEKLATSSSRNNYGWPKLNSLKLISGQHRL